MNLLKKQKRTKRPKSGMYQEHQVILAIKSIRNMPEKKEQLKDMIFMDY